MWDDVRRGEGRDRTGRDGVGYYIGHRMGIAMGIDMEMAIRIERGRIEYARTHGASKTTCV